MYTGTSGNLVAVGGNDDNSAVCGAGFRSYGSFISDGSTTYYINVNGYAGTTGLVDMTISCASTTPPPSNADVDKIRHIPTTIVQGRCVRHALLLPPACNSCAIVCCHYTGCLAAARLLSAAHVMWVVDRWPLTVPPGGVHSCGFPTVLVSTVVASLILSTVLVSTINHHLVQYGS